MDISYPAENESVLYVGLGSDLLYALNTLTGERHWLFQTDGVVGLSPTVADGTVYASSQEGKVYAIDAVTRELRWSYQTEGSVLVLACGRRVGLHRRRVTAMSTRSM